jgi:hypothetical protein
MNKMVFNQQELSAEFSAYAESRPKISTHCHQLPARELQGFDLEALLRNSYVNWCGVEWDSSPQSRHALLEKIKFNSFFVWLQESLAGLYGDETPLTASSWPAWNERIRAAYREPAHARQILAERCHYQRMLLDAYWEPGSDNGAAEFFAPAYRVNAFFFGYSPTGRDHDGNNPYLLTPRTFITDLDEYVGWVRENALAHRAAGCVALKIPIAYDRGLDFEPVDAGQARQAFARLTSTSAGQVPPGAPAAPRPRPSNAPATAATGRSEDADPGDVKTFQDYLFFQICALAGELDLPVQIHTGMGQARRTNAALLQEAIQSFPETRFVLLHCSYPWIQDVNMLVDKFPNVFPDLSMVPLLSTRAAGTLLHDLIERATAGRLFWGCDTWTAEESFGALLAFRHVLSSTLAEKVLDGYLTRADAFQITDDIFLNNPLRFYKSASSG